MNITTTVSSLMSTYPRSTLHVLRILMRWSFGHVTLLQEECEPPKLFPQSDLGRQADSRWFCPKFLVISHLNCYIVLFTYVDSSKQHWFSNNKKNSIKITASACSLWLMKELEVSRVPKSPESEINDSGGKHWVLASSEAIIVMITSLWF